MHISDKLLRNDKNMQGNVQHKYTFDVFGIQCRIALACFLVFPLALYIRLKSLLKWVAGIKEGFFVDSCIFFT